MNADSALSASRVVALTVLVAIAPGAVRGQSTPVADSALGPIDTVSTRIDVTLPAGRVIRRLVSRADTSQRYALYLPSSISRDRQWPVLFLLDPRGRALVPMQRFRAAAERLGYIVISSYNTLSDGPAQPNYAAMTAMMDDVQRALPVDSRRFYLAGFSGTARFAWQVSTQIGGAIAGIVGTGASVPGGSSWTRANIGKSSPVLFGTIGTLDSNYEEMRAFEADLDAIGTPHHIERFDGGHQWPPVGLATRAVEWLELQAMRRELRRRDQSWVDSLYASWLSQAGRIDSLGDAAAAVRAYRLLQSDFQGMTNLDAVGARLTALANDPRLRRTEAAESAMAERDRAWVASMLAFSATLERSQTPPSLDNARKALDLDWMQREAARADDSTSAVAARRSLERVFTHFSFYAPRQFFDARRYAHAAAALRMARLIKPDDGGACFWHARALAQTGDKPNALQALECAAASRQVTATAVEGDPLLAPLHGESRYDAVVRQLRSGG
jgi:predicted esterase